MVEFLQPGSFKSADPDDANAYEFFPTTNTNFAKIRSFYDITFNDNEIYHTGDEIVNNSEGLFLKWIFVSIIVLVKHMANKLTLILTVLLGILLAGCTIEANPIPGTGKTPTVTPTPTLRPTATLTPTPETTAGLLTPAPGRVPVTFSTAIDSPQQVWFEVYSAGRRMIFQGGGKVNVLYLPEGDYFYNAMVPIPTQPLWCYFIEEEDGFSTQGKFTVKQQPIQIEVKLGVLLLPCTPTPTP